MEPLSKDPLGNICVVLQSRVPFWGGPFFFRVPYYMGNLNRGP